MAIFPESLNAEKPKRRPRSRPGSMWLTQRLEIANLTIDLCKTLGAELCLVEHDRIEVTGDLQPEALRVLGLLCKLCHAEIAPKLRRAGKYTAPLW